MLYCDAKRKDNFQDEKKKLTPCSGLLWCWISGSRRALPLLTQKSLISMRAMTMDNNGIFNGC